MSITTAIPTIKNISNIDVNTINKLYAQAGIPQPHTVAVRKSPSILNYLKRDKCITIQEVNTNMSYASIIKAVTESVTDVIVEEVELTPYITVRYTYNKLNA